MPVITHKKSSTASSTPATTDLALGELAVNTNDGKLFLKKDDGTESIVEVGAGGGGASTEVIHIQHKETRGTNGGTYSTANTWQKRPFTDELTDTGNNCTLTSSEFTLDAGTYVVSYFGVHYDGSSGQVYKARLYNVTDAAEEFMGTQLINGTNKSIMLEVTGVVILAAQKTLRIEHISSVTETAGFGLARNVVAWGDEKYANLTLTKIA